MSFFTIAFFYSLSAFAKDMQWPARLCPKPSIIETLLINPLQNTTIEQQLLYLQEQWQENRLNFLIPVGTKRIAADKVSEYLQKRLNILAKREIRKKIAIPVALNPSHVLPTLKKTAPYFALKPPPKFLMQQSSQQNVASHGPITQQKRLNPLFFDAFYQTQALEDIHSAAYSKEWGDKFHYAGWLNAFGENYYPTLNWVDSAFEETLIVPLIHKNFFADLFHSDDLQPAKGQGFIVGKIGPRTSLEAIDGVHPIYFQKDTKGFYFLATDEQIDSERYFVFPTLPTGVKNISVWYHHQGADFKTMLYAPVRSVTCTFLDFKNIYLTNVQGVVTQASHQDRPAKILPRIKVSLEGSNTKETYTQEDGSFFLPQIAWLNRYPLFLITENTVSRKTRAHRHKISFFRKNHLHCMRFSSRAVADWFSDFNFEPTINTALAVSCFSPAWMKKFHQHYPLASAVKVKKSWDQKIFSIHEDGYLNEDNILHSPQRPFNHLSTANLFISLSVPQTQSGLVSLYHPVKKKIIWSEFTVFSPGVLTVLSLS